MKDVELLARFACMTIKAELDKLETIIDERMERSLSQRDAYHWLYETRQALEKLERELICGDYKREDGNEEGP